ncbi:MAG TPA: ABC transporter substrate-binding protein [Stellaceae bacterium]|jgi:NitT/TauT family transport system substrate-binding protein|nr:ABC transporter substrate-binding protein [Stellaceae bacterium]
MRKLPRRFATVIAILAAWYAPSAARAAETIVYGAPGAPTATLWPLFIGIEQGFFAAENLGIEIIYARSSANVVQQVAAGSLNVGETGVLDPLRAIDANADLGILCVQATPSPYGLVVKPDIKTVHDLKGKLLAVGIATDIARNYLDAILVANGMSDGDIDSLPSTSTSARLAAMESGAAVAGMLTAPALFRAQSDGFALLALSSDYPTGFPFEALSINRSWAASHQDAAKKFLAVHLKAVAWLDDPKNRDAAIAIMVKASGESTDDVTRSLDLYQRINFFDRDMAISKKSMRGAIELLQKNGDIKDQMPVEKVLVTGLSTFRE